MQAKITKETLKAILSNANDDQGHHVLWVDTENNVHLNVLPDGVGPNAFQASKPNMRARFETFAEGAGYVGAKASDDESWVNRLIFALTKLPDNPGVSYIDHF